MPYTTRISLLDAAGDIVDSPTLATGDVKISIDGGAYSNITTLPTVSPSGGGDVVITLSDAEVASASNAIVVDFQDQAGDEWDRVKVNISISDISQETRNTETWQRLGLDPDNPLKTNDDNSIQIGPDGDPIIEIDAVNRPYSTTQTRQ